MIRKADPADIGAIMDMAEVAFRHTYSEILSPAQMEYMMDWMYSRTSLEKQMTMDGHIFFIEDGKGYVSFRYDNRSSDGRDVYHLEKLYVLPSCQGQGLGLQLFNRVVEEAVKLSGPRPVRIELNVNRNNPAAKFYEHIGMYKSRQGDFPIGDGFYMNDYIMAYEPK